MGGIDFHRINIIFQIWSDNDTNENHKLAHLELLKVVFYLQGTCRCPHKTYSFTSISKNELCISFIVHNWLTPHFQWIYPIKGLLLYESGFSACNQYMIQLWHIYENTPYFLKLFVTVDFDLSLYYQSFLNPT